MNGLDQRQHLRFRQPLAFRGAAPFRARYPFTLTLSTWHSALSSTCLSCGLIQAYLWIPPFCKRCFFYDRGPVCTYISGLLMLTAAGHNSRLAQQDKASF